MADTTRTSHTLDTFEAQHTAAFNNPSPSSGREDPFEDHPLEVEGDQLLTTSKSFSSLRAQQPSRADDAFDPNFLHPTVHNTDANSPVHNPNLDNENNIDTTLRPALPLSTSEHSSLTVQGTTNLDLLSPIQESPPALPVPTYPDEPASGGTPGQLGETGKENRKPLWIGGGLGIVVVLFLIVFFPVFFRHGKKPSSSSPSAPSSSSSSGGGGETTGGGTTGGVTGGHGGSTTGAFVSADKWPRNDDAEDDGS